MYQITFLDCGTLQAVTSPSYRAIEALFFNISNRCHPRIWNVSVKGKPVLIC